ncbi:MAG: hypothetical protein QXJ74_03705 [Nitrososphaera sp.]
MRQDQLQAGLAPKRGVGLLMDAGAIVRLKAEFAKNYRGSSHMHEAVPNQSSASLPVEPGGLAAMHAFAKNNPIYFGSKEMEIAGIPCTVYEGDINEYWLSSIKHDSGYQPFYPTWILSAYALAIASREMGFEQIVDIGSGDGRIAYCAKAAGLGGHGIEIDPDLVELQKKISSATGVDFDARCADATQFDYSSLGLTRPLFYISGLPEMGEMLANSVLERILSSGLKSTAGFVLMGSHVRRKFAREHLQWGWGEVIARFGLEVKQVITLPTHWTADQPLDTPYIFAVPQAGRVL